MYTKRQQRALDEGFDSISECSLEEEEDCSYYDDEEDYELEEDDSEATVSDEGEEEEDEEDDDASVVSSTVGKKRRKRSAQSSTSAKKITTVETPQGPKATPNKSVTIAKEKGPNAPLVITHLKSFPKKPPDSRRKAKRPFDPTPYVVVLPNSFKVAVGQVSSVPPTPTILKLPASVKSEPKAVTAAAPKPALTIVNPEVEIDNLKQHIAKLQADFDKEVVTNNALHAELRTANDCIESLRRDVNTLKLNADIVENLAFEEVAGKTIEHDVEARKLNEELARLVDKRNNLTRGGRQKKNH